MVRALGKSLTRSHTFAAILVLSVMVAGSARAGSCGNSSGKLPLSDLLTGYYLGYPGGLYPGSSNIPPAQHHGAALTRAAGIQPLDAGGSPDPCGKIVLLSIGLSNANHKFAAFERQEDLNPLRNPRLVLVSGAQGGETAEKIADPTDDYWDLVTARLDALGLSEEQVQVVWLEEALQNPPNDFPGHALVLRDLLEQIVQKLHVTFPNLQLCYISNRTYGGYNYVSPEPQAYETGFAVKWLIEDQIGGRAELNFDPQTGPVLAPLLLWGPDLWADGHIPRSDGLTWCACDFENCFNVHPSASGEQKVADLLSEFFSNDATAQPWFLNPGLAPLVVVDAEADAFVWADAPDANFGSDPSLLTQGQPVPAGAYVRFDVSTVARPVHYAKLSFRNLEHDPSDVERDIRLVSDSSWIESSITFTQRPPIDGIRPLRVPRMSRDGARAHVVTGELNTDPDGLITFVMTGPATAPPPTLVHSRESGQPPRLILEQAPGCFICGDGTCDPGESCSTCAVDCGLPEISCDDVDNDCNLDTPDGGVDLDGDGVNCELDCNRGDPSIWTVPGQPHGLLLQFDVVSGVLELTWQAPLQPGTSTGTLIYDTLRSTDPADFTFAAICIESGDGSDTQSHDPQAMAPSETWYYLIQASNDCGTGALGSANEPPRSGRSCP